MRSLATCLPLNSGAKQIDCDRGLKLAAMLPPYPGPRRAPDGIRAQGSATGRSACAARGTVVSAARSACPLPTTTSHNPANVCQRVWPWCSRHYGISVPYARLVKLLGTIPGFGTPSFRIANVGRALGVNVEYGQGTLAALYRHLQQNHPPIVFVQTGQLPDRQTRMYITQSSLQASMDAACIVNDPAIVQAPIAVPLGDFDLAWLGAQMNYMPSSQAENH